MLSCIEPPPKISADAHPHLEITRFQFEKLEGILIDDETSSNSRAIVYVGDYKEKDIPCFYETWKKHQRALVVFHTKDLEKGISYLQNQGYTTVETGEYPCL